MARCPFARWVPSPKPALGYVATPWKVVHHKTIGLSENAAGLYTPTGSWPHFTVGRSGIQQHIDTDTAAFALEHRAGTPETNRARAIQIELVAIVAVPAHRDSLAHLNQLLRWLETAHGIPWTWPSGRPRTATANGRDPGGHNRSATNWRSMPGHYGHSQVPANSHWDPFYYDEEWAAIQPARGGETFLTNEEALAHLDRHIDDAIKDAKVHAEQIRDQLLARIEALDAKFSRP